MARAPWPTMPDADDDIHAMIVARAGTVPISESKGTVPISEFFFGNGDCPPRRGSPTRGTVPLPEKGTVPLLGSFAVAVVLAATGSTPRKAGTKAIIDADGTIHGTIGGGAVELEAQRLAVEAIRTSRPLVFDFALEGGSSHDDQPICGGAMRILLDPAASNHRAAYAQAVAARSSRQQGVLLTTVRNSSSPTATQVQVQWLGEESLPADLGFLDSEAVRAVVASQTPQLYVREIPQEGVRLEVLVEPIVPPPLLLIAGGGHVGQALARQASLVGFAVVVIDDRPEFTDPALFRGQPGTAVQTRCGDIARELAEFPMAADTYVAIVTRGHQHDQATLAACLTTGHCSGPAYIGMIGSRRKVAMIRKGLIESGVATELELDRVYAPIGLDIGAQTVPEIAASIVAQLIAVRRGVVPGSNRR